MLTTDQQVPRGAHCRSDEVDRSRHPSHSRAKPDPRQLLKLKLARQPTSHVELDLPDLGRRKDFLPDLARVHPVAVRICGRAALSLTWVGSTRQGAAKIYRTVATKCTRHVGMKSPVNFYRWWIVDPVTGERVLTPFKLTSAHAALAFPGAKPDLQTREARELPDLSRDPWSNTRPGEPWEDSTPVDPWAETSPQPETSAKAPSVGEMLTLPSGRVVMVTPHASRQRPWAPVEIASVWYVRGKQGRDDPSAFLLDRMRRVPLELNEADALALAKVLNQIR